MNGLALLTYLPSSCFLLSRRIIHENYEVVNGQSLSGYKAELFPLRIGDELRRSALDRRQRVDLGPDLGEVYLHAPEDLILYKLWTCGLSQQSKHLRDIGSIVTALGDELDSGYIEGWARRKGLSALWGEILKQTG